MNGESLPGRRSAQTAGTCMYYGRITAMKGRAARRHQAESHMNRRLSEDRNQHYDDLKCVCWTDPKAMARFKEQPRPEMRCRCCANPRRVEKGDERYTMQERRAAFVCD